MTLESYFPYIEYKERSPITIGWVEDKISEDLYNILITDRNGISVRDSKKLKKEEINREIGRLASIEEDRGYSVVKNCYP